MSPTSHQTAPPRVVVETGPQAGVEIAMQADGSTSAVPAVGTFLLVAPPTRGGRDGGRVVPRQERLRRASVAISGPGEDWRWCFVDEVLV